MNNFGVPFGNAIIRNIALKEAAETEYWIKGLAMSGYIDEKIADSLIFDCLEIKRLWVSTVKTAKEDR